MNPRYYHWQIAYRKKGERTFRLIENPSYAWAADPFLVEYNGRLLLFAELFLYRTERNGVIGYCEYNGSGFGRWQISMDEHWHLSYPNVFVENGKLFMIPESYQKNEVGIYELVEQPDKWIQRDVLFSNVKYVDTTFLDLDGITYLFMFEPTFKGNEGKLLMCRQNNDGSFPAPVVLSEDKSLARPGGNFVRRGERLYRIGQDCEMSYGSALSVCQVDQVYPHYAERVVKKIEPSDIRLYTQREILGIHTYNELGGLEVIDVKYYHPTIGEALAAKRTRKVFLNKYE